MVTPAYRFSARLLLLLLVVHLSGLSDASAQWGTGFFNTNDGWVREVGFAGQNTTVPESERWQGNDPYDPLMDTGETDSLAFATGYTPGGSGAGNSSLIQGGAYLFDGILPGASDVRLWRSFAPISGAVVAFRLEWSVIDSLDPGFANLDTFAFDLRTSDNAQSLLRLSLTPSINIQPGSYTLQTIVDSGAGLETSTLIDLAYRGVFAVDVEMTGTAYDVSVSQLNPATRATITSWDLVSGASLAEGLAADDFGTVSIDWELTSGDPEDPGSNYIIVNEVSVVPEPSTYALLVLAGLGAAYVWRRRVRV